MLQLMGYQLLQTVIWRGIGATPTSVAELALSDKLKRAIAQAAGAIELEQLPAPPMPLESVQGKRTLWRVLRGMLRK